MPFIIFLVIVAVILYLKFAPDIKINKNLVRIIIIAVVVLFVLISSIRIIQPGHLGIQVLLGKVQNRILRSGIHIVVPIVNVVKMSIRTQEYTMTNVREEGAVKGDDAIVALTKDGLSITLDLTVWFKLEEKEAAKVYETIGPDYIQKIVRPAIRTAIRDAAVMYNVTEIYSEKRQDLVSNITISLKESLEPKGIMVDRILLRNIVLPDRVKNAIDEKIAAEQDAQKMVYVLQKEERERERKLIEANGIADAQKRISSTLSSQYLSWYYIQNLKEALKTENTRVIIMPFDQKLVPLLNLDK